MNEVLRVEVGRLALVCRWVNGHESGGPTVERDPLSLAKSDAGLPAQVEEEQGRILPDACIPVGDAIVNLPTLRRRDRDALGLWRDDPKPRGRIGLVFREREGDQGASSIHSRIDGLERNARVRLVLERSEVLDCRGYARSCDVRRFVGNRGCGRLFG